MAIIFDGNKHIKEEKRGLIKKVKYLRKEGIIPCLVSILVGDNPVSIKYLTLKKETAEKIGAEIEIVRFQSSDQVNQVIELIKKLNSDKTVHGIMLQLPLPSNFSEKDRGGIISAIDTVKDVDGMREDSIYLTPVVKAVLATVKESAKYTIYNKGAKVVVVGAKGFVGKKIMRVLKETGYDARGVDLGVKNLSMTTKFADILISVTGVSGLIKGGMVKKDSVVIDVGSPLGDVVIKKVSEKAKFISPVPGGVGPLTIYYLLENLVEAASGRK